MRAYQKAYQLAVGIDARTAVRLTPDQANILRRAEKTLHRWHELECGDGNDHASWAIERDDAGMPYMATYPHNGHPRRIKIADRERGALRRVDVLCRMVGLNYYVQTDPRGCALYVSHEPMTDGNYTKGVACCD